MMAPITYSQEETLGDPKSTQTANGGKIYRLTTLLSKNSKNSTSIISLLEWFMTHFSKFDPHQRDEQEKRDSRGLNA